MATQMARPISRLCLVAQRLSPQLSAGPKAANSYLPLGVQSPSASFSPQLPLWTQASATRTQVQRSASCRFASRSSREAVDVDEAVAKVKAGTGRKFIESADVVLALNIDPRKAEQNLRGLAVLPHGTGKELKVAVFAEGAAAEAAQKAGATYVGGKELVDEVANGFLDFERCVATPGSMKMLSKVARILGPRGLMPNAKLGTVTEDVATKVKELQSGVQVRAEKAGLIHATFGRVNMEEKQLKENLNAIVDQLVSMRPRGIKEPYIKDCFLSSSMGPSIRVSIASLLTSGGAKEGVSMKKVPGASKGKAAHAIDPADWATVDLDAIRSKKLRRYLEARRAAAEGEQKATA